MFPKALYTQYVLDSVSPLRSHSSISGIFRGNANTPVQRFPSAFAKPAVSYEGEVLGNEYP